MIGTYTGAERRQSRRHYSAAEASFVTRLPRKAVEQAITRREIQALRGRRSGDAAQTVGERELVYLESRKSLVKLLTREARRALYQKLAPEGIEAIPSTVDVGGVRVDLEPAKSRVRARLGELHAALSHVSEDPAVCGGVPVVRGTRIPVHGLADLVRQGASVGELLEDHPALTAESLNAALLFARINPRRGRPPAAPWAEGRPRQVLRAGELDAG